MKRDMELIRAILLEVEKQDPASNLPAIEIEGYDNKTVFEHAKLMEEGGLINGCCFDLSCNVFIQSLTWSGYDYLDKIRDTTVWEKTKVEIKKNSLPFVIETVKTISDAFVKAAAEGVATAIIKNGGMI